MTAEIGAWAFTAESGKKGETGHQRHEEISWRWSPAATAIADGAEHADGAEQCRGKADEMVFGAMYPDVKGVGGNGGEQHQHQANAIAGEIEKVMEEDGAEETVAEQMDDIGMEGQGGGQTIDFSLCENGLTIAGSGDKPESLRSPRAA